MSDINEIIKFAENERKDAEDKMFDFALKGDDIQARYYRGRMLAFLDLLKFYKR